jgi:hypothetical protein
MIYVSSYYNGICYLYSYNQVVMFLVYAFCYCVISAVDAYFCSLVYVSCLCVNWSGRVGFVCCGYRGLRILLCPFWHVLLVLI